MVYGIIRDHKGSIKVDSVVGQGTTFTIRLPAYKRGVESAASTRKIKILVVDDELSIRESLSGWLRQDGFEVDSAADGQVALALTHRKSLRHYAH